MSRRHPALTLTLALAGAGLPVSSAVAITTPQIAPLAPFTAGEGSTLFWSPARDELPRPHGGALSNRGSADDLSRTLALRVTR